VKWYRDEPGWISLMQAVREGRVWTLAVWRLDRLGRTAGELATRLEDLAARDVDVRLVSLEEGLALAPADVRALAAALAGVARSETLAHDERIAAGIAAARERGVRFGRPSGPGKRLKVAPQQKETIRRLKAEGKKITAIARTTNLSRPTVSSVLAREVTSATTCGPARRVPVPPGPDRSRSAAGGSR
jgi:DNA invertase Pin-like site-specific DNA recombinase